MAATLLVPGTSQRFAGSRRVGGIALRVWLAVVLAVGTVAIIATQRPTLLVSLASSDTFLSVMKGAVALLGVGWLFLILDTWRLARPHALARGGRLVLTGTAGVAFLLVAAMVSTGMHLLDVQRDVVGNVFTAGPAVGEVDGRYNVLVLGGDAGEDREGLRPDSLTVASVDAETGQAVLVGIPRNLMKAPFPEDSPFAESWPNGYDCGDECIINSLYTWGTANADDFPQYEDPGLEATRQAAEGVTGLSIPYTVVVDMAGFEQFVDALGGVTVDVGKRVPIGGGTGPIEGYIEPGVQELNGYQALWFARSREGASDYERMVRQKCLSASLARQADPITVLSNFEALADASAALIQTDIPTGDLPGLLAVAQQVPTQEIAAVSLVPPLVNPVRPDFTAIHTMVQSMLLGEPVAAHDDSPGDGSVGNEGSNAAAATQGSVDAAGSTSGAEADPDGGSGAAEGKRGATEPGTAGPSTSTRAGDPAGGKTAAELGLVCQPV